MVQGWAERRTADTATGRSLMQCQRNRLLATDGMEGQQNSNAMLFVVAALAHASITLNDERIVCEGAEIVKTMQVGQDLAANFLCQRLIQRLEYGPSCRLRHGADYLQTQSAHG